MRETLPVVTLAILVTIAVSPALAADAARVSAGAAVVEAPSPTPVVWPPVRPRAPNGLHFRGDSTVRPTLIWVGRPATGMQLAPRYFIDADSSDHVNITRVENERVWLESPGEWEGSGVLADSIYWGVFAYRDDARDPRNRGARGTHRGTFEPSGRLRVHGTFTNRAWPDFERTWTPVGPGAGAPGDSIPRMSLERLLELPVDDLFQFQHPVWPPEPGRAPESDFDFERPIWPPEHFRGDLRTTLPAVSDTTRVYGRRN